MSETANYFYVYGYFNEDGTPYYIGKGHGYRMYEKHSNVIVPPRERIKKLYDNISEEEAFDREEMLIFKYGRRGIDKGGILKNIQERGHGCKQTYHTLEEQKKAKARGDNRYWKKIKKNPEKHAERKKYKTEWAYKKARKQGKPKKEECGRKFKVVCPEGKVYEGINCKPFAEEHNLDPACFTSMVRGDITHHNGWVVYGFKPPEGKKQKSNGGYFPIRVKNIKQYSFKMIDPQGNIHEGFNQREFAEQHRLNVKYLNRVLTGKRMTCHGGWKRA